MELIAIFRDGLWPYLLLCLVSVAMGLGLLQVFRVALPWQMVLTFAPLLSTACWTVMLGIGVTLRIPVGSLTNPLWLLTFGLGLLGLVWVLSRVRRKYGTASDTRLGFAAIGLTRQAVFQRSDMLQLLKYSWLITICAVLPIAVMFPYFAAGLTEHPRSTFPDGWAYSAYGQYLWHYARGAEGGLAPLHQFGARLSHTRFIASSFLGFLSPFFSPGDTQMASGLFLAWALFTFTTSCAFFGLTQGLPMPRLLLYIVLVVFSGWVCNMLFANNYDNALALAYFPVLVGTMTILNPHSWPWRFVLGFLGAGLLYCYPELAVFMLGGAALVALNRCWIKRQDTKDWLLTGICGFCVAVALLAAYIPQIYTFMLSQVSASMESGPRPGEGLFIGLLQMRYQPAALWGLGGEYSLDIWLLVRNALGFLLLLLAGVGLWRLIKQRQIGFAATIILLVVVSGSFIVVQRYSYGAYKVILLTWWMACYTLVLGLDDLMLRFRTGTLRYAAIGLCASVVLLVLILNHHGIGAPNWVKSKFDQLGMSQFRQLEQIKQITGNAGLFVLVDDWLANEWAVYFLRNMPIDLGEYRMYMAQPQMIPFMDRARSMQSEEMRYVLTDAALDDASSSFPGAKLVWSGGPYHLWEIDILTGATITAIENANGIEKVDGERFFWMGQGDTSVDVFTHKDGILFLRGTFLPGPSVPGQAERTLLVLTDTGYQRQFVLTGGDQSISLPVATGKTKVTLRPLDKPTIVALANGDTRPLILGVKGITAALEDNPVVLEQVQNAYGVDQVNGKSFFWMGQEPTKLRVYAIQAGQLTLQTHFVPGPSLPDTQLRRMLVESDAGYREQVSIADGEQRIQLPIPSGMTTITLTVLDTPTVVQLANGDKRTLLLGFTDLTVRLDP